MVVSPCVACKYKDAIKLKLRLSNLHTAMTSPRKHTLTLKKAL